MVDEEWGGGGIKREKNVSQIDGKHHVLAPVTPSSIRQVFQNTLANVSRKVDQKITERTRSSSLVDICLLPPTSMSLTSVVREERDHFTLIFSNEKLFIPFTVLPPSFFLTHFFCFFPSSVFVSFHVITSDRSRNETLNR